MKSIAVIAAIVAGGILLLAAVFLFAAFINDKTLQATSFIPAPTMDPDVKKILQTNIDGNFVARDIGVVHDNRTGLDWFAGPDRDTSWKQASAWVEKLDVDGGGWRLPASHELATLFKKGPADLKMTPLFRLTGTWGWAGETGRVPGYFWSRWEAGCYDFNFEGCESRELRWYSGQFRVIAVRACRPANLMEAAWQCDIEALKALLAAGADVDAQDADGCTALLIAVRYRPGETGKSVRQYKIVQILVDNGADIHAKQKDGHSALYYASKYSLAQVIKILNRHGARKGDT